MLQEKSSESKAKNMINIPAAIEPFHNRNGLDNNGMLINRVKQTKNSQMKQHGCYYQVDNSSQMNNGGTRMPYDEQFLAG